MYLRSLAFVFVLSLMYSGCDSPVPQLERSVGSQSPGEAAHDPFGSENPDDSSMMDSPDFDELVNEITNLLEPLVDTTAKPVPDPFDPPLTIADTNQVLQQCIQFVLTSPELQSSRQFYGTPQSTEVVLANGSHIGLEWPVGFKPIIDGFDIRFGEPDSAEPDKNRVLGIRLDKLDARAPCDGFFDGNITFTVFNAGGTRNGAVIGGCNTFFVIRRQENQYVARFAGSMDP